MPEVTLYMNFNLSLRLARYALAIAFCLAVCPAARGQNKDSLLTALKGHIPDTTRVNILAQITHLYENINVDSMIIYGNQGLALANRINFQPGKASCLMWLGLAYLHLNNLDTSLSYYREAQKLFEKTIYTRKLANIDMSMADIYYRQAKYDQAIDYYKKGIAVCDESNNPTGKGFGLISIGGLYSDLGNYSDAINNYLNALKAFEKDNYIAGISMTYTNMATVYSALGSFEQAKECINKSLEKGKNITNKEQLLLNYCNIGIVYNTMKEHEKALLFFNKAWLLATSIDDDAWKAVCAGNIADAYYGMKKYDTAATKYLEALAINNKVKDPTVIAGANSGLGRILIRRGQTMAGIQHLLLANETARKSKMNQKIFESALDLSDAYQKLGDNKKALEYYKIFDHYQDSVHNERNSLRIKELQFDYDLGKKEAQINLLKKDKVIVQIRNGRQKAIMLALTAGVICLLIASLVLYRSRRREQQSKETLYRQKQEIELQSAKLEELNRFKDKTFSVLSHDLRGPLASLTTVMTMLDQKVISIDEFNAVKPDLTSRLNSLNLLLDNLLNWAKSYIKGNVSGTPKPVNLNQIAQQNINLVRNTSDRKQITIINDIPAYIQALCDFEQIDIVVRNLLMNAVKFTRYNGSIHLSAFTDHDIVKLSVTDNGIGMTEDQLQTLFTPTPDSAYGTEGERGTGLGLILSYGFIKENNGSILVTSEVGKGSTFTVTLPAAA
jgi:signal transduction histidine kinase